jgi:hypothetical protein
VTVAVVGAAVVSEISAAVLGLQSCCWPKCWHCLTAVAVTALVLRWVLVLTGVGIDSSDSYDSNCSDY